jgi:hypothetical protein
MYEQKHAKYSAHVGHGHQWRRQTATGIVHCQCGLGIPVIAQKAFTSDQVRCAFLLDLLVSAGMIAPPPWTIAESLFQ